jgi:phosphinothricin acetyltransferase
MMRMHVRDATLEDAAACAAVYAPYVRETAVSFELEPPDAEAMRGRMARAMESYAWLVLEDDGGRVVGYAYGGRFAPRAAYRFACEVSVYLDAGARGVGGGRALYTVLLERLAARGYRMAFAGMTLPNDASAGLHRALGFEPCGVYRAVGWKDGAWHDVAWMQKSLAPGDDDGAPPPEPR